MWQYNLYEAHKLECYETVVVVQADISGRVSTVSSISRSLRSAFLPYDWTVN